MVYIWPTRREICVALKSGFQLLLARVFGIFTLPCQLVIFWVEQNERAMFKLGRWDDEIIWNWSNGWDLCFPTNLVGRYNKTGGLTQLFFYGVSTYMSHRLFLNRTNRLHEPLWAKLERSLSIILNCPLCMHRICIANVLLVFLSSSVPRWRLYKLFGRNRPNTSIDDRIRIWNYI